ncbi:hypothetical protein JN01_0465 [Entomoplasma freundtii]|uniref:Uncharacterized protein n=1 Tax=Entomoplasma freundtii TaxID=74700 RepID=A0A2K8NQL3_9MOLU|nr:hypothetical protein [Entomoplasma freundtii]ATZ16135.1 hypothetical protein EFREU_v1c01080 [Entomoplasma freundtii]TDY56964.1 hypothetical protein JN01_0465 [Entomoplasma freundtii]
MYKLLLKSLAIMTTSVGSVPLTPTVLSIQNSQGNDARAISPLAHDKELELIRKIKTYKDLINNKILTNPSIVSLIEAELKGLGNETEMVNQFFDLFKTYHSPISYLFAEISKEWYKPSDGDIKESMARVAKQIGEDGTPGQTTGRWNGHLWARAQGNKWTWNNFYTYSGGIHFNEMIHDLTGAYLGNIIDDCLHLGGGGQWGFETEKFANRLVEAGNNIFGNKKAQKNLIQALMPLIKDHVMKKNDFSTGYEQLIWAEGEPDLEKDFNIRLLFERLAHLFSQDGKNDLIDIVSNLVTSPFFEDVLIDTGFYGQRTFTEAIEMANNGITGAIIKLITDELKPRNLATMIVNAIEPVIAELGLDKTLKDLNGIFDTANHAKIFKFRINLPELASSFESLENWDNFDSCLENVKDFINNKNSQVSLKNLLQMLGTQEGADDFVKGSPLENLKKNLDDDNSLLQCSLTVLEAYYLMLDES